MLHVSSPFIFFQHNEKNKGMDINVTGVWERNITGRGVTVVVIDDGVEHTHQDIQLNYVSQSKEWQNLFFFATAMQEKMENTAAENVFFFCTAAPSWNKIQTFLVKPVSPTQNIL